jgi:hypothetical protein
MDVKEVELQTQPVASTSHKANNPPHPLRVRANRACLPVRAMVHRPTRATEGQASTLLPMQALHLSTVPDQVLPVEVDSAFQHAKRALRLSRTPSKPELIIHPLLSLLLILPTMPVYQPSETPSRERTHRSRQATGRKASLNRMIASSLPTRIVQELQVGVTRAGTMSQYQRCLPSLGRWGIGKTEA